jgi:hypothetical protein
VQKKELERWRQSAYGATHSNTIFEQSKFQSYTKMPAIVHPRFSHITSGIASVNHIASQFDSSKKFVRNKASPPTVAVTDPTSEEVVFDNLNQSSRQEGNSSR